MSQLPLPSSALVGVDDIQTITSKFISGKQNTLTNIGNSSLSTGIDAIKIANGSVSSIQYQYLSGATSNIQAQLNAKSESTHTHNASDIILGTIADVLISESSIVQHQSAISISMLKGAPTSAVVGTNSTMTLINKSISGLTNVLSDIGNGSLLAGIDAAKIANGSVTSIQYQYLSNATSNIQDQLNNKAATSHVHSALDITSGVFGDQRISLSSVRQHSPSISISSFSGAPLSSVVGINDVQSLTHKTLDSDTNVVMATKLKTSNGSVVIGGAPSPTAGQVLAAVGDGTATWQTPGSGTGTVTSVSLSMPSEFAIVGSPITTAGTLAISKSPQSPLSVYCGPSIDITLGSNVVYPTDDSGKGGILYATKYALGHTGTIRSMSFYVTAAVGDLKLGVYSNSNTNDPNSLVASTESFTPMTGWNTIPVISPVQLQQGTYWLVYLAQSSNLHFRRDTTTGTSRYYAYAYGSLPGTWMTVGQTFDSSQPSIYASLTISDAESNVPTFRTLTHSDIPDLRSNYCDLSSAQNLSNKLLYTNSTIFADHSDNSKRFVLGLSNSHSGSILTLTINQTSSRILNIPNISESDDELMTTRTDQIIYGTKTLRSVDMLTSSTTTYSNGTISQSSTTVTGTNTTFTKDMTGGLIVFNNGSYAYIIFVTSTTSLVVTPAATHSPQTYTIYYGGYQQDNLGNVGASRLIVNSKDSENAPLAILGASNNNANLTEWRSSTGSVLSRVTKAGDYDMTSSSNVYRISGNVVISSPNSTSVLIGNTNNTSGSTLGINNNFMGVNAGKSITTGTDNTLVGFNSGQALTTQKNNTFSGAYSGHNCIADSNLFMGRYSGYNVTVGSLNVAIGEDSLKSLDNTEYTGSYNTLIGQKSSLTSTSASRACVFGYLASAGNGGLALGSSSFANENELAVRAGNGTYILKSNEETLTLPNPLSTLTLGSNVISFPSATDTLLGATSTQTIQNKTLTHSTNNITSRSLWVDNGTTAVSTYEAQPPTAGQILKATSSTTATWQTVAGMTWRGAWSAIISYNVSDIVYNGAASWICILTNKNRSPPDGTYWNLLTDGFRWKSTWSAANTYNTNDVVSFNSVIYVCIATNTNQQPPSTNYWSVMMSTGSASALLTTTGTVAISAASPPSSSQVLTATSSSTAEWKDITPSCLEVFSAETTSTTSVNYTLLDSMTLTPPAGTYLITFSADAYYNSLSGTAKWAIFKFGVIIQHTERKLSPKVNDFSCDVASKAKVSCSGTDVIEVRYSVSSEAFVINSRSLHLLRVI